MANSNFSQTTFLAGEWSPFYQGRIDNRDYPSAMNVCRNAFPIEEGAWLRRSGTRFMGTTLNGSPGRVIPFAFEQGTPYYMEFTDGFLRFFSTLSAAANIGLVPGVQIATPYTGGVWSTLRSIQAETEAILLQPTIAPRALTVSTLPTPSAYATFALAAVTFLDGPYLDPPTDGSTLTPSAKTGTITITASALGSINGGAGFLATDVGRLVRLLSVPPAWAIGTTYAAGSSVSYGGAYFTSVIASNVGNQPDISIAAWTINTTAAVWSWGTITAITSASIASMLIQGAALLYTGAIATWRLGVYSNTTGYPSCGVYYEGRIWLAGSIPNRVDASMVNQISNGVINMSPTAVDGTVADNNAISYTFNSTKVNPIRWMIGEAAGIVCGTQSAEWVIKASQLSDPITPTSIQAHQVTTYGSENIEAVHCELTMTFVQRYGRTLLEYFPDVFSQRFTAPSLSQTAKHLTVSGLKEIRYQQELVPIIWARCGDGSLAGVTYKRISMFSTQGPNFCGWHRHDLGSGRLVESIAVGPSKDGNLDNLVLVTNDPATNVRHVELMNSIFEVGTPITSGWFLDDAVTPTSGSITIAGSFGTASTLTLNGFPHLNGKKVTVSCGGMDCGDYVVSGGSITLPIDSDPNNPNVLSSAYLASISSSTAYGTMAVSITGFGSLPISVPCIVGFSFTSQGQCLRPDTLEQTRSPIGPGAQKPRKITQFGALVTATQGISFGTNFSKMHAAQFKSLGEKSYTNLQLFTGPYWETMDDTYSMDGMMCWQVSRPYPACLNSISGWLQTQER